MEANLDLDCLMSALPQLVRGLMYLHRAGKLHGDMKPSNVLVDRGGRVVVCDFGSVAEVSGTRGRRSSGSIGGTPVYMSPEQASEANLTAASDWYSAGVMLYEALTGRLPFVGTMRAVLEGKLANDPPPPRSFNESLPARWNDLCMALLTRDPSRRADGAAILAALGQERPKLARAGTLNERAGADFVGRASHLAALRSALDDARDGRGVAVLVSGRSGMGKSALVDRFLAEVDGKGEALIFAGRCFERESVPHKSLDAVVDEICAHLMAMPAEDAVRYVRYLPHDFPALVRVFPVLGRVEAGIDAEARAAVPRDVQELRSRAFGALRELLDRLAASRPVLLYVDDLQWGDVDSVPLWNSLIRQPRASQLLLLATYRVEEVESSPFLVALLQPGGDRASPADLRELAVEPLSDSEARELVALALSEGLADARVDSIVRDAGGNPFFVAELARLAAEKGEEVEPTTLTLDEMLEQRIAALSADASALLTGCAVAGRPMQLSLLSRAVGVRDEPAALASLSARRLVRSHRGAFGEEVETYHDRIRETAVGLLSAKDARRVHRRLARAFEAADQVDQQALVEHWVGAGDDERAGRYALQAALQAERAVAFDRAAHHYQLALELLALDESQRRDLLTRLGDALACAANLSAAADAFLEAARGASRGRALDLRRRAVEQVLRCGRLEEGLAMSEELLRSVGIRMPRSNAGSIASILFSQIWIALRGQRFEERPPDEIDPEAIWRMDVCWSVAASMNIVNPILSKALQLRYVQGALRSGDAFRASLGMGLAAGLSAIGGHRSRDKARAVAEQATELAERTGDPRAMGIVEIGIAGARFLVGDFAGCEEYADRSYTTMVTHCADARYEADQVLMWRLSALIYLGRIRDLVELVPRSLQGALERGDEYMADALRSWRSSFVWLALGDPEQARRQLDAVTDEGSDGKTFHVYHYYQLHSATQIDLYEGQGARAFDRLERDWRRLARSVGMRVQTIRVEAHFLRARCALAAAAEAQSTKLRRHLLRRAASSLRALRKEQAPWGDALANLTEAQLVRAEEGDPERAISLLADAERGFEANGMELFAVIAASRRGEVLGGEEGGALRERAGAWMTEQRVADPPRVIAMYAPAAS